MSSILLLLPWVWGRGTLPPSPATDLSALSSDPSLSHFKGSCVQMCLTPIIKDKYPILRFITLVKSCHHVFIIFQILKKKTQPLYGTRILPITILNNEADIFCFVFAPLL